MASLDSGPERFHRKGGRAAYVFRGFRNNTSRIVSVGESSTEYDVSELLSFESQANFVPIEGVRNRLEKTAPLDTFAPESEASMTNFEANALLPKLNHLVTYDTGGSSVGGSDVLQEIIETQIKRFLLTTTQDAFNQKMNALEESRSGILDDIGCRLREQEEQLQHNYNPNDPEDPTMRRVKNALGAYEFSSERIFSEIVARMQSEGGTQKAFAGSGEIRSRRKIKLGRVVALATAILAGSPFFGQTNQPVSTHAESAILSHENKQRTLPEQTHIEIPDPFAREGVDESELPFVQYPESGQLWQSTPEAQHGEALGSNSSVGEPESASQEIIVINGETWVKQPDGSIRHRG